ncbi:MAG: hypothetical protein ACYTEK_03485 [Planctomycetota bacterium]|jgi:hypothetical protein
MSFKSKNKRVGICLMVVATCIVVTGLWAVLAIPETALAAPPDGKGKGDGDTGTAPVCIAFEAGGGIQSDDGTPYCNNKQLKVKAIMTQCGHVDLQPNTGSGDGRIMKVSASVYSGDLEGTYFFVGWGKDSFDMRAMEVGEIRTDVNLMVKTKAPDGHRWWFIFDPTWDRWGIDYSESTYVTVTRKGTDTWEIQNTTIGIDDAGDPITIPSRAVRVISTKVKNKSEFTYGGVATVPLFKATVTLAP